MAFDLRNVIAGLAAGAGEEGDLLTGRAAARSKIASEMALEKAKAGDAMQWQPLPYEIDLGDGKGPGAVEFNKQTGGYRRPQFPTITPPPAPTSQGAPSGDPSAGMAALTGEPPVRRAPIPPPISSALPGNPQTEVVQPAEAAMQRLTSSVPTAPSAPPVPATTPTAVPGVARVASKQFAPRAIDPRSAAGITADSTRAANTALARADPLARRAPRNAMVDGVPKVIWTDGKGISTDQSGVPVTGKITPYVPPPSAGTGAGGGFGAGGTPGAARFVAGVAGLHNAHDNMVPYEQSVATHQATFDGLDYYKKLWGQMYDEKGVVNPAIHATVMANLGTTNPDLANYLQSAEMWALEDASISNRPSDFRTKLDGFVSALKPDQNAKGIEQMQHGRLVRLQGYDAAVPAVKAQLQRIAGPGTPTAPPTPTPAAKKTPSQLWDEAVKLHGKAKVLAEFGPRPPEK